MGNACLLIKNPKKNRFTQLTVVFLVISSYLCARLNRQRMTFDKILDNNTLWAVRYDSVADNALKTLFDQWSDPEWLVEFFLANMADFD